MRLKTWKDKLMWILIDKIMLIIAAFIVLSLITLFDVISGGYTMY